MKHSIPQVILGGLFKPPGDEFGFQIYISAYNTIFLFIAVSVAYGMVSFLSVSARKPVPVSWCESVSVCKSV